MKLFSLSFATFFLLFFSTVAKSQEDTKYIFKQNEILFVAKEAILAEGGDSKELENSFANLASSMKSINTYLNDMQAIYNSEVIKKSGGAWESAFDLVEIIVPFTESSQAGRILGDMREATGKDRDNAFLKGLALLGSSKKEMKDIILSFPIDERVSAARLLVKIINENDRVLISNSNDMARLQLISIITEPHSYSDVNKVMDNIISWVKAIGIIFFVGWITKPVRAARKASKLKKVDRSDKIGIERKLNKTSLEKDFEAKISQTETLKDDISSIQVIVELQLGMIEKDLLYFDRDEFALGYVFGLADMRYYQSGGDLENQTKAINFISKVFDEVFKNNSYTALSKALQAQSSPAFQEGRSTGSSELGKWIKTKGKIKPLGLVSYFLSNS